MWRMFLPGRSRSSRSVATHRKRRHPPSQTPHTRPPTTCPNRHLNPIPNRVCQAAGCTNLRRLLVGEWTPSSPASSATPMRPIRGRAPTQAGKPGKAQGAALRVVPGISPRAGIHHQRLAGTSPDAGFPREAGSGPTPRGRSATAATPARPPQRPSRAVGGPSPGEEAPPRTGPTTATPAPCGPSSSPPR